MKSSTSSALSFDFNLMFIYLDTSHWPAVLFYLFEISHRLSNKRIIENSNFVILPTTGHQSAIPPRAPKISHLFSRLETQRLRETAETVRSHFSPHLGGFWRREIALPDIRDRSIVRQMASRRCRRGKFTGTQYNHVLDVCIFDVLFYANLQRRPGNTRHIYADDFHSSIKTHSYRAFDICGRQVRGTSIFERGM